VTTEKQYIKCKNARFLLFWQSWGKQYFFWGIAKELRFLYIVTTASHICFYECTIFTIGSQTDFMDSKLKPLSYAMYYPMACLFI
jgi:hypothetical protein